MTLQLSTFEAKPPFPKTVRNALRTLGLPLSGALQYEDFESHVAKLTIDLAQGDSQKLDEVEKAYRHVRNYSRGCYQKQRGLNYLVAYETKVKAISDLVGAAQQCVIRHSQASELYDTLASIASWIGQQNRNFTEPWKSIRETTATRLRSKASLMKKEAGNMAHFYDELRHMGRCCRLKDSNKIIPTHPYPNEALMEWFEDLQNTCGRLEIPAAFQQTSTSAHEP